MSTLKNALIFDPGKLKKQEKINKGRKSLIEAHLNCIADEEIRELVTRNLQVGLEDLIFASEGGEEDGDRREESENDMEEESANQYPSGGGVGEEWIATSKNVFSFDQKGDHSDNTMGYGSFYSGSNYADETQYSTIDNTPEDTSHLHQKKHYFNWARVLSFQEPESSRH